MKYLLPILLLLVFPINSDSVVLDGELAAITVQEMHPDSEIDPYFDKTEYLFVFEEKTNSQYAFYSVDSNVAEQIIELEVTTVITGCMNPETEAFLRKNNINIIQGVLGNVMDVAKKFLERKNRKQI